MFEIDLIAKCINISRYELLVDVGKDNDKKNLQVVGTKVHFPAFQVSTLTYMTNRRSFQRNYSKLMAITFNTCLNGCNRTVEKDIAS